MTVADFKMGNGRWTKRLYANNKSRNTFSYQRWKDMHRRCRSGTSAQVQSPHYIGCSVVPEWETFDVFMEWAETQIGFSTKEYNLDKDLLVYGNLVYSPETCLFLPSQLNSFFISSRKTRGQWPQGVCWDSYYNKFRAQCSVDFKVTKIGLFDNPDDAHQAYKKVKENEARKWAQRLINKEFLVEERVIECLLKWELPV